MVSRLRAACGAVGDALAFGLASLPALVAAMLVLRIAEAIHAAAAGLPQATLFGAAIANDALALLRYGVVPLLLALPLALVRPARARLVVLGVAWSLLLCAHAALLQYGWSAGVPLGADLFAYSTREIGLTATASFQVGLALAVALPLALTVLWTLLVLRMRLSWPRAGARSALVALTVGLLCFALLPERFAPRVVRSEAELHYVINKSMHFADSSLAWLRGDAATRAPWQGKDAAYPFLRPESTPDTLGPLLKRTDGAPPNLVFLIVEGLGRDFSGPGARLGSFTPFLDELATRSLYFENFLAPQGRTFGVLTSIFGSLPFGEQGLAARAELPRHASLTGILKEHGYRTRFYSGSNLDFDNEAAVLRALGVDSVSGERDFGASYTRANDWGYADRDLVQFALERERTAPPGSHVSILQTTSMHSPFTFPGQDAWLPRVDERLRALGLAPTPVHARQRAVFASILYTDDALRLFFDEARKLPGYANTIFIVTGDHRLPELPMDSRIERFHVPLIVYSPLLRGPRTIKSVSSQFDLAPALLAYLANNHGLKTPAQVAWMGSGLDTEPSFRNLHVLPLKQNRTEMSDFVSGAAYLAQDRLYALADGMALERIDDPALLDRARAQFDAFLRANALAGRAPALVPPDVARVAYGGARQLRGAALLREVGAVVVSGVRPRPGTGALTIEATVTNHARTTSRPFVPLLVVMNEQGVELGEVAGPLQTLAPGESVSVSLRPDVGRMPPGRYRLSVLPSDPETGRPIGAGQYQVALEL